MEPAADTPTLKRALRLPHLVFYGLGITVGAGIFALIGEIVGIAGDHAPLAFVIAGILAAITARSYAVLARRFPKAAGAAVYAEKGFGPTAGRLAGFGVILTGIISSSVIALAFAGYVGTFLPVPQPPLIAALLAGLAVLAWWGVKESVSSAAVVTVLEIGTLAVIAAVGLPALLDADLWRRLVALPVTRPDLDLTVAAAAVCFFAFLGFEDIVNVTEETIAPERTVGPAIALTLAITTLLYVALAAIAAAMPDRAALAASDAPLSHMFNELTGLPGMPISAIAAVAMLNGILIQTIMASRVIYGMGREGLLPAWLGAVEPRRRTPLRAIALTALAIAALAYAAPLLQLAQTTSYVILAVFALVNFSLFALGSKEPAGELRRARWFGFAGGLLTTGFLVYEIARQF